MLKFISLSYFEPSVSGVCAGPGPRRPVSAERRLGLRRPQQPDGGWLAVGLRSQDEKIRIYT